MSFFLHLKVSILEKISEKLCYLTSFVWFLAWDISTSILLKLDKEFMTLNAVGIFGSL